MTGAFIDKPDPSPNQSFTAAGGQRSGRSAVPGSSMSYPSTVHAETPESVKNVRHDPRSRGDGSGTRRSGDRSTAGRKSPDGQTRSKNGTRWAPPVRGSAGGYSSRPSESKPEEKIRPGTTRMFASVVPGMATLVTRQLDQLPGVRATDAGFDGRSDLVLFDVDRGHREVLWSLRTIEDLFVEVGRTMRSSGDKPHWIAGRIWRPERVEKALSVWSAEVRPLAGTMTYRVIARVLQEQSFLRTELRKALTQAISTDKPKWRFADPAQVEVWTSEYQAGQIIAGLRLSDASMRQHDGREVERSGALRPTVAAMMVSLAGQPDGTLLDPCCGSGTILSEAVALGWPHVRGGDIDPQAVEIARRNARAAQVDQWDLRRLDLPDSSVGAVVANLPFGQQFEVQGSMSTWLAAALAEMGRVTRPGGRLVLLAPNIPASTLPAGVRIRSKDTVRLLGTRSVLWVFDRTADVRTHEINVGD